MKVMSDYMYLVIPRENMINKGVIRILFAQPDQYVPGLLLRVRNRKIIFLFLN